MTDNEIIKALTEWSERGMTFCNVGMSEFARHTLALINRQKSKILKEQNKNSKLRNERNHLKAEIERLEKILGGTSKVLSETCAGVRVEAVKEFAERLKKMHRNNKTSVVSLVTVFDNINNLVKEMVGEG